jgi:hypothetical protein
MSLPKIEFTSWHQWKSRDGIKDTNHPGVYVLAKFSKPPSGQANLLDKRIIYFGETCNELKERWHQFERSAFRGQQGHSGGRNYREEYGDEGHDFVCCCHARDN